MKEINPMLFIFLEAPVFSKYLKKYIEDQEYTALKDALVLNPERGDEIDGTGGFRKLQWQTHREGRRNRGGVRIIYFHLLNELEEKHFIFLVTLYDKQYSANLSDEQKKRIKSAMMAEQFRWREA